jgi:FtsZ-interacting cell division protein YlmF
MNYTTKASTQAFLGFLSAQPAAQPAAIKQREERREKAAQKQAQAQVQQQRRERAKREKEEREAKAKQETEDAKHRAARSRSRMNWLVSKGVPASDAAAYDRGFELGGYDLSLGESDWVDMVDRHVLESDHIHMKQGHVKMVLAAIGEAKDRERKRREEEEQREEAERKARQQERARQEQEMKDRQLAEEKRKRCDAAARVSASVVGWMES